MSIKNLICIVSLFFTTSTTLAIPLSYELVDLGVGEAYDINNLGQVVGSGVFPGSHIGRAFIWDKDQFNLLQGLGGYSQSLAINNNSIAAGWAEESGNQRHTVFWNAYGPTIQPT